MDRSIFAQPNAHPFLGMFFSAIAVAILLIFPATASAAPQSLGLVATAKPVPMICDVGGCVAQLSSFCLQEDRAAPNHHTPYYVAGGAGLWLHLTDSDGGQRTVPADSYVQLESSRGYTGVEVNISAVEMAALGAVEVSVEVGKLVTLFPETAADDPNPLTKAERTLALGPARHFAAAIYDSPSGLGDTISILDRAINMIDRSFHLSYQGRLNIWSHVAGAPLETPADFRMRRAAKVFSTCLDDPRQEMVSGFRHCLEGRRYELLMDANFQLWDRLAAGS